MNRDSFNNALRATAKIACAASLLQVGCRSKTSTEVATPQINDPLEHTDISSDNRSPREDDSNRDDNFNSCQNLIKETFATEAFPTNDSISQEVKDCCTLTAQYYDALALDNQIMDYSAWEHRNECCSAVEWSDGSMACTPWGPPTPPSAQKMKRRRIVHQHAVLAS